MTSRQETRGEAGTVAAGAPRAHAATNRVPCLVLLSERYGDKVFPLQHAHTSIGRSIEREVLIDDPQVSKRHAEIARRPDGKYELRDLGSRNGTRVNGEAVTERVLRPGDRIELGDAVTLFFTDKQIATETTRREVAGRGGSTGAIGAHERQGVGEKTIVKPRAPSSGRLPKAGANGVNDAVAPHALPAPCACAADAAKADPEEAGVRSGTMAILRPDAISLELSPEGELRPGTEEKLRAIPSALMFAGRRLSLPHEEVAAASGDRRPARVMGRLDEGSLTIIYQIAEALGAARTEKELFERALELTSALIPADHTYVFLPEEPAGFAGVPSGRARIVAARAREATIPGLELPASTTIVEQVLKDRTAVATTDAAQDERFMTADSVVRNRIRAVMAAPLVVQGRATGVLYLDHEAPGYLFNRAELHLLTAIAFHVGHALETARALHALERRVEERTQEIQRLAQERAELLAMAAHDLKTPLAGLVGYLECLAERASIEGAPAWVAEEMAVLNDAGRSMMDLLCDLLDSQRAEAGRIAVSSEATDLGPFLRDTVAVYERWALGVERRVELVVPDGLPVVSIDRRRVTQILNNLVHNGLKYTPRGGCVRIEARIDGAARLELAVVDEGAGFKPSDSDRILLSFERGTSAEPARGAGHGLGLAIVKKLVTMLGGALVVDGRPGRGARFAFTLPR